jgi:hypothetical protein
MSEPQTTEDFIPRSVRLYDVRIWVIETKDDPIKLAYSSHVLAMSEEDAKQFAAGHDCGYRSSHRKMDVVKPLPTADMIAATRTGIPTAVLMLASLGEHQDRSQWSPEWKNEFMAAVESRVRYNEAVKDARSRIEVLSRSAVLTPDAAAAIEVHRTMQGTLDAVPPDVGPVIHEHTPHQ